MNADLNELLNEDVKSKSFHSQKYIGRQPIKKEVTLTIDCESLTNTTINEVVQGFVKGFATDGWTCESAQTDPNNCYKTKMKFIKEVNQNARNDL